MSNGVLLALITAVVSGLSIFVNKLLVIGINPYIFTFSKNALVAVGLTFILHKTRQLSRLTLLTLKDWLSLILIGLVGGSLPFLLFFQGLSKTSAVNAAFIHKNLFVFVAIFASLWLKEKLDKKYFLAAIGLMLANALLLKVFAFKVQAGDKLILAATVLWAIENVLAKKLLTRLPALIVAFGRMVFGSLFIAGFLVFNGQWLQVVNLDPGAVSSIIITAAFLLAYVISWYSALKRLPASLAAMILTLASPITTLLSLFILGVMPAREQVFGLVLFGLVMLGWRRQRNECVGVKVSRTL